MTLRDVHLIGKEPEAARAYYGQQAISGFGRRLRERRKSENWTLEELSEKVGTTPAQLSNIERGMGKRGPSLELMARIVRVFGEELVFLSKNQ